LPRRSRLRQGQVPQRVPLPDAHVGRRRRDRVARRRGRDHQPEGAPQVLLRAVRADHEEDLLGGVVPHPARPRRDPRDGHRDAGAVRARAGGARPLVGAAYAVPWQPDPEGRGPDVPVADQVAGERGGAPAVPRRLRAADPRARPRAPRPEAPQARRRRLGVQRARLGRAEARRHRPRPEDRGAARLPAALPRAGAVGAGRRSRRMNEWEVFRRERKGQPFEHAGSVVAPDADFAEAWAREQYGRRGESVALWLVPRDAIRDVEDWADEFDLKYRRVDGYSIKARLKEARERAGTAPRDR